MYIPHISIHPGTQRLAHCQQTHRIQIELLDVHSGTLTVCTHTAELPKSLNSASSFQARQQPYITNIAFDPSLTRRELMENDLRHSIGVVNAKAPKTPLPKTARACARTHPRAAEPRRSQDAGYKIITNATAPETHECTTLLGDMLTIMAIIMLVTALLTNSK